VQTTLRLIPPGPAARSLTGITIAIGREGLCAVPVTDTPITSGQECVSGYVVFVYVGLDLGEGPGEKGIELEHASGVDFEGLERSPICTLGSPTSCDDGTNAVFVVCSVSGLDLDEIVVCVLVGLPQALAVEILKILSRVAKVRLVDMDLGAVTLPDLLDEIESFLKMVECVEKNEGRGVGGDFGQDIDADEARETKGSRLVQSGEVLESPLKDFSWGESAQGGIESI